MSTPISDDARLQEILNREDEERRRANNAAVAEAQRISQTPQVKQDQQDRQDAEASATGAPSKPNNSQSGGDSSGAQAQQPTQPSQNQPKTTENEQSPGQRGMQEIGTAVVGGAIDAVEGLAGNAQQVLTGQINNEDFTPTWLQWDDNSEPQNKTWWGRLARDVVQYTALTVGLRKAAGRINTAPTRFLAGQGQTLGGSAAREAVRGAVVANLGTMSTEDNASVELAKVFPWFDPLATKGEDSPITRRLKNTLEAAGFDFIFDRFAGFLSKRKVARNAEVVGQNEKLRQQAIEQGAFTKDLQARNDEIKNLRAAKKQLDQEVQVATQAAAEAAGTPNEAAILAELQAKQADRAALQETLKTKRAEYKAVAKADPLELAEQAGRETEDVLRVRREANLDENARHRFEEGALDNGPDPYASHPDLFDGPERSHFSANPNIREATIDSLFSAMRVDLDARQALGRIGNILTEAKYEKILKGGTPAVRKVLDDMIEELKDSRDFAVEINGRRYSKQDSINLVAAKAYDAMKVMEDPDDIESLKKLLLENPDRRSIAGQYFDYLNDASTAATQLLIRVTSEELADISNVIRSYEGTGIVSTEHLENLLTTRLEFLLKEHKKAAYMRGSALQSMKKNWVASLMPSRIDFETRFNEIDQEVGEVMQTIRGTMDAEDKRLLSNFITAASISDGNIRTIDDMTKYMRERIGMRGWLAGSPEEQGYMLQGLTATFYNSVLSAPRTILRAWLGTGLATSLRPLTLGLGGLLRGDQRLMAKSLAQVNIGFEGVSEALTMLNKSHRAWIDGKETLNDTMIGLRIPYHKTKEFQALEEWAELKGHDGDKAAVRRARMLSQFNDLWAVNYSQGLMDMGDSFFRTLMGRMELKARAFDEAWNETGGKVTPELVKKYEKRLHDQIFDSDGLVTDKAARMAGNEATLTTPLQGMAQDLERLIQSVPPIKPFILFPRTALNAMRLTATYTPVLNGFIKEVHDILNATPQTAPRVMAEYGITDLAAAQAMLEGRVALGQMVVMAAGLAYVNGRITGNGSADRAKREADIQNGWMPRSIKIGDTWVGYDGLEPFHTFLALVADIGDNTDELGSSITEDWLRRMSYVFAQNVTNKSFISGIAPLVDILTNQGGEALTTVLANTANHILPWAGARNATANAFSPAMRELSSGFQDKFMNRNPGLRTQLPVKYDVFTGKPIRDYDFWTRYLNAFSPITINADWSPTREELRRSGYDLKNAFTTDPETSAKLEPQVISLMQREMSTMGLEDSLKQLFSTKAYRESRDRLQAARDAGLPNETVSPGEFYHIQRIDNIFKQAKRRALVRVKAEIGETEAIRRALTKKKVRAAGRQGDFNAQDFYLEMQQTVR